MQNRIFAKSIVMNNRTGSPVIGDDFFGREKELEFAWTKIKEGNSFILAAPRRVGKTSFALRLLDLAKLEKWNILQVNLEEIKSEAGFVALFIEKIQQQSWWQRVKNGSNIIERLLTSIKPTFEHDGIKASLEWQSKKADIYETLKKLIDHGEDTLIMVDEVTILLNSFLVDKENGVQNVTFFLNWLRSFRQVAGTKIRWVFCSSIGIDNFTHQHQLSYTFNDVDSFPIGAFDLDTSRLLLKALSKSDNISLPDEVVSLILFKIGWQLPYFIQLFYSKIVYSKQVDDQPLTEATVQTVYKKLISEKHLNTWDERLRDYGTLETNARLVLNRLCQIPIGEKREMLETALVARINDPEERNIVLSKLIYMLENDGYLAKNDGRYLFRSPLIKDFWFNRFIN